MASRSARRSRARQPSQQASHPYGATGLTPATYTADQVLAIVRATGGIAASTALPRNPLWSQVPFNPGQPLNPAFISPPRKPGQQPPPRLGEYPLSYNVQVGQVSAHVPWDTLQRAADMPLFRKCIERRKAIAELDYAVTVDPAAVTREALLTGSAKTDVEAGLRGRYTADISRISEWLAEPDRKNGLDWTAWGKLLLENMLKYDAAVVYPRRTLGGDLYSLEIPDGHLFKPLIDESGGRPLPPYPAVQQILYGFPRGEYTADIDAEGEIRGGMSADEILYRRRVIRGFGSPYGMPPVEIALLDGLVWMRRMGWILAEYTEGAIPATLLETSPETGWSPDQWADWLQMLNEQLGGSTQERMKFRMLPPGAKAVQTTDIPERYKPEYDMFLVKLVAGDFGLTATELGFPEVGSLGASFHEGEEDVLNRVTRIPDCKWLAGIATELMIRHLGMPPALKVTILGLESEDEAAADAVALARVVSGRMTINEDRARQGVSAYDFAEADMPMLQMQRGVVFLDGASELAPAGAMVAPAQAPPPAAPGQQDAGPGGQRAGSAAGTGQQPKPGSDGQGKQQQQDGAAKAADADGDVAAWRKWRHNGARRGQFECTALAKADAPPEMAADGRVVFKAPGPKVPARRGLAGTGTRIS
jgi:hypothetical protein